MKRSIFLTLIIYCSMVQAQQLKPLKFLEEIHDFGYVDQGGGPVSYSFQFANVSNRPIKILSVQASCGCTTPDWSKEAVTPGTSGFIQASFDPKGRPGFFNKSLTVTTDFDSNPVVLQIKGQVSSGDRKSSEAEFKSVNGSWRLKMSSFNLGKVYMKDEFAAKEFPLLNAGDKPVTFLKADGPSYIRADALPKTLKPGETGKIRISYNGKEKGEYGFQSDNIEIHTDDAAQPVKSFTVYATLEEFFPVLSPEDVAKAPRLSITDTSLDLGRTKQHQALTGEVSIGNTGRSELVIRAVQGNCSCITTTIGKEKLKPGENSTIKITFDPQDRIGTHQKSVTVYSNDPQAPVQRITFTAYTE
ncbi:MAG TPA: DUF1573 domain-containing protein [Cyclobacteriaceae bacterium]|nr:DUF1573 domain-containing protein [Cyclobacteriaceae bacterium]